MGFFKRLILTILFVELAHFCGFFSPRLPPLDPGDGWWAKDDDSPDDVTIRSFSISFGEKELTDLKRRLRETRFFESLEETNWSYGARADQMKIIVDHWLNSYSWPKQQKVFNRYQHFKTKIEGIDVHFLHAKPKVVPSAEINIKPIIMVHGWPGSFYEFYKIIPMLTDPRQFGGTDEDYFEVICPSIPGYGFSEAPHRPDFDSRDAARIFHTLMHQRLGFKDYYVQGGDWGSQVVEFMSLFYPDHVRGHHSNFIVYQPPLFPLRILLGSISPSLVLSKKSDQDKLFPFGEYAKNVFLEETGYFHLQATKPDTVGHALTDSPVGLAAYILEKFTEGWSHPAAMMQQHDGGLADKFDLDDLLNNIMVYWISGSITSSMRMYKEFVDNIGIINPYESHPIVVPTAVAVFPYEIVRIPEPWLHYRYKNLVSYTDMPDGGHFAALEKPTLLADDIRQFARKVENKL